MKDLKKIITTKIREYLNESYKLTFNDKKEIENIIRYNYDKYKKEIEEENSQIEFAKKYIESVKKMVDKGERQKYELEALMQSVLGYRYKLSIMKPMLFNQYYDENINYFKQDYINYKNRQNVKYQFKTSPKEDELKNFNYKEYYNNLTDLEKKNINKFIKIVVIRVDSGTGESINRKEVRDAFFRTPKMFQNLFSEKPSNYLWRGDYGHPCKENDYDFEDKDYLSMQSFTNSEAVASQFGGDVFSATIIKSYSGSFSIELYNKYGGEGDKELPGDDEGEVMFFDVEYKCKK